MPPRRLFVLIAGNFFVATSFLSVGGLLSEISTALNVPIEKAGLLIAAFGIAAAVCAPVLATLGFAHRPSKVAHRLDGRLRVGQSARGAQPDL